MTPASDSHEINSLRENNLATVSFLHTKQRPEWRRLIDRFVAHRLAVVSLVFLLLLTLVAVWGPWLVRITLDTDAQEIHVGMRNRPPSWDHPFGNDELGRDLLARIVDAVRITLIVGMLVVVVSNVIGLVVGGIAGAFGGAIDTTLMVILDTLIAIPSFYLLLAIASYAAEFTITGIIVVIALTSWMGIARIVRADFIALKNRDYVLAARSLGASQSWIIMRQILPNVLPTIIVATSLSVGSAIIIESALSFLGLGVQTPRASLGTLLSRAQQYVWTAPRLAIIPGMTIVFIVLAFNYIGDGLREALDPRLNVDG
ncbi:MAG: ABC transporter permease [Chloroflexota bacterium]